MQFEAATALVTGAACAASPGRDGTEKKGRGIRW